MSTIRRLLIGCFCAGLLSCTESPKQTLPTRYGYPDVLNVKEAITQPFQEGVSSFSDLGTWHSFSLSHEDEKGSFSGPFLMRQQESFWLSPALLKLQIKDVEADRVIDLSRANLVKNVFYPGLLEQHLTIDDLDIKLRLFNTNERSTAVWAEVHNAGAKRYLALGWNGTVFNEVATSLQAGEHSVFIGIDEEEQATLHFKPSTITIEEHSYSTYGEALELAQGQNIASEAVFMYTFNAKEQKEYLLKAKADMANIAHVFRAGEERWNKYIAKLYQESAKALLDVKTYDRLAVKSLLTLMHNWRSSAGTMFHQGIVPSYSTTYFQGLWAWDSWKHAVAIVPFEEQLAKDQIRAMYDYQNDQGMIADCFFRDLSIEGVNWRNTKAPLSGWAIYEVYKATGDTSFLKELYPKLLKYHQWWYLNRDHDGNGLCEYGSTDGTRIAAAWESGMDNAVRFDDAVIIKNGEGAYSINRESVDLNAYLAQEKRYIQKMASALGDTENEEKYRREAAQLTEMIQNVMFSAEDGYYYDVVLNSQEKIRIQGPEGWAPLYNRVATDHQAAEVVKVMMDTTRFNTPMPFPTLSASHKQFNPQKGYWRGPVWLDQAYFGIVGMQHYGFDEEAAAMAKKVVESAEGLAFTQAPIRENYHPITREGLNAMHFSWSAAHILMLF